MPDMFTKEERSRVMATIRSHGNRSTEIAFINILRKGKIRGWRRRQQLLGKPDFVFREARVAVFIDGCFWHGCAKCSVPPKSNREYWNAKLLRNRERDREVTQGLRKVGWR